MSCCFAYITLTTPNIQRKFRSIISYYKIMHAGNECGQNHKKAGTTIGFGGKIISGQDFLVNCGPP